MMEWLMVFALFVFLGNFLHKDKEHLTRNDELLAHQFALDDQRRYNEQQRLEQRRHDEQQRLEQRRLEQRLLEQQRLLDQQRLEQRRLEQRLHDEQQRLLVHQHVFLGQHPQHVFLGQHPQRVFLGQHPQQRILLAHRPVGQQNLQNVLGILMGGR
jgi:hypothetical protein